MSNLEMSMASHTTTTVVTSSQTTTSGIDHNFVKSLKGIFRIIEMVLALVAFICAAVGRNHVRYKYGWDVNKYKGIPGAAGWCMFVTMFSLIIILVMYFLWLFSVLQRSTPRVPINFMEFIMYIVFGGFYLIAGIVAAAFGRYSAGLAAASFFCFVLTILCICDAVFCYRDWLPSGEGPYSCRKPQDTHTTTTHTSQVSYPSTGH